jgi:hypothetical protein
LHDEAKQEKQRIIEQRVRISQEKSSARLVCQPELASGARAIKEGSIKKYLNMVHVRSVAFFQLYFCFKQAVFNLVFSYMVIDLGTEDPKSQKVIWCKSWQSQTKRLNSFHGKHVQVSLNNHCHSIVLFDLCENQTVFVQCQMV